MTSHLQHFATAVSHQAGLCAKEFEQPQVTKLQHIRGKEIVHTDEVFSHLQDYKIL